MNYILSTAIAALFIGVVGHVDALIVVGYVLIGVQVVSRAWTERVVKRLRISREVVAHAFPGDRITVTLRAHNMSRLPLPWLYLRDNWAHGLQPDPVPNWALTLRPHERQTFRYDLLCRARGFYALGPIDGKAGALLEDSPDAPGSTALGTDRRWATAQRLTVYPAIVPLERLGLPSYLALGNMRSRTTFIEDPARIAGVRDYQAGDDPRFIDWRTSARLGSLSVKQFERSQPLPLAVFLDLRAGGYSKNAYARATEVAIVVAASLCAHAIRAHQQAGLFSNGFDSFAAPLSSPRNVGTDIHIPLHSGEGALIAILETLARIQPDSAGDAPSLPAFMQRWSMDLAWGATVAIITPALTPDLLAAVKGLRKAGFAAVCLFTDAPPPLDQQPSYAVQARAFGLPAHDVNFVEDILELSGAR